MMGGSDIKVEHTSQWAQTNHTASALIAGVFSNQHVPVQKSLLFGTVLILTLVQAFLESIHSDELV